MRLLVLLGLSSCAAPLIEAERRHCLYSLECELDERCIQQRCVRLDAGARQDAGPVCEDPDSDGAHLDGLIIQREETQRNRHVGPSSPDQYIHQLTVGAQVHAWAVAESGPAPVLHVIDQDAELPTACAAGDDRCSQGGRLTGLTVTRVEANSKVIVAAPEAQLTNYELGVRFGNPCDRQTDCGGDRRCVQAIAERPDQVGTTGICVFAQELEIDSNCDRTDPSSEHAESAPDTGALDELTLEDVPTCQHDNDWYTVRVESAGDVTKTVRLVSVPATDNELSGVSLFIGLYSPDDLRPLRFQVIYFPPGTLELPLSLSNLAQGEYRLRITQINARSVPSTYSLSSP